MEQEQYDVIIVGTGAAGLFAALNFPSHQHILMITKSELEKSDSYLAQGGICVLKNQEDYDSFMEDTLRAGRYKNRKESVDVMINTSRQVINQLIEYGVDFEKDEDGNLLFTREGAHSDYRILYHKDETGKEIVTKLIEQVKCRDNIVVREHTTMIDIIPDLNACKGVVVQDNEGKHYKMFSKTVILATGGIGGTFSNSTNYRHLTGDGIIIALKHGIELENLHYIQIHPTSLYTRKEGRRFLISESVRGEGAVLLNEEKERFVDELLPRDVVTEAIRLEMEKSNTEYVYLSFHDMKDVDVKERFPAIYKTCLKEGYDITTDLLPVTPAQHYLMGGIKVSIDGESSMNNLYAIGETSCNGVHGANRLASNSLLESLVFAGRAASKINHLLVENVIEYDFSSVVDYQEKQLKEKEKKQLILNEIQRKDREFYDKWCDHENEYR